MREQVVLPTYVPNRAVFEQVRKKTGWGRALKASIPPELYDVLWNRLKAVELVESESSLSG